MIRILQLALASVLIGATAAQAQSPASSPEPVDSAAPIAVTTFAVKSGKIALSSASNPKPVFLPDGTYKNESGTVIAIVDGVIAKIERDGGEATFIETVRMNRDRQILLTPSTTALMQVADIRLPSGTYTSVEGQASFSVVMGRPTSFTVPAKAPEQ